jgi:uncharacterized protein YfiM (DUF2279 family)
MSEMISEILRSPRDPVPRLLVALLLILEASSLCAQEPVTATSRASLAAAPPDSLPADRWIAPDKAAHVFAGFWTAGVGYAAASRLDAEAPERRAAAVAAGLTAGVAKEAFDALVQRERFSWKDLVADAAGILLLVAVTAAAEP